MLNEVPRLFVRVTVFAVLEVPTAWLPNDKLAGDVVAWAMPTPLSESVCGLLLALSVTVSVPVRAPVAVGVKATLIVQLAPEPKDVPQVFVCAKSPVTAIDEILNAVGKLFFSVTVFVAPVVASA
jgi:hypothetical protein